MSNKDKIIRILVIDSNEKKLGQLINHLEQHGFYPRSKLVKDLDKLNAALEHQRWDLCLFNIEQNKFDAKTIANAIKNFDLDIPLIALTAQAKPQQHLNMLKLGFVDYLQSSQKAIFLARVQQILIQLHFRRDYRILQQNYVLSEQQSLFLLETSKEAICYLDNKHHICYANHAFSSMFGFQTTKDLLHTDIFELITHDNHGALQNFIENHHDEETNQLFICHGRRVDNTEFAAEASLSPINYQGQHCTQVIVRLQQVQMEIDTVLDDLKKQDLLTGFYNSLYFIHCLDEYLARNNQQPHPAALLYLEIDQFSVLKDDVGLSGSDLIVGDVAQIIRQQPIEAHHYICRYSDAAFTILIEDINEKKARIIAEELYTKVNDHIANIEKQSINISCSIGISQITSTTPSSQESLARAYNACLQARKEHTRILSFKKKVEDDDSEQHDKALINYIYKALQSGKFQLKYQPLVNLHGEPHEYYEVVVRLQDEQGNNVRPDDFFPAAQTAGLLAKIDRWVILHVINVLAQHRLNGNNTFLFVMLSKHSILDEGFLPWLRVALANARLPSDALIFELHENDCAMHIKESREFILSLKQLRCKTVLSRYGSGLDSFNTLKKLDVDFVKFDGSYTQEISDNNEKVREEVAQAIHAIHNLGKLTIITMVEDALILPRLWNIGANYIQGYFVHPPTDDLSYEFSAGLEEDQN